MKLIGMTFKVQWSAGFKWLVSSHYQRSTSGTPHIVNTKRYQTYSHAHFLAITTSVNPNYLTI